MCEYRNVSVVEYFNTWKAMMGHGQGDSIGKGRKFTGVSVDCVEKLNFDGSMYASTNAWIGHKIIIEDIWLTYTHPSAHADVYVHKEEILGNV